MFMLYVCLAKEKHLQDGAVIFNKIVNIARNLDKISLYLISHFSNAKTFS